jgi:hypothetical protein
MGISGDEDRRDRAPCFDQTFVELYTCHIRHVNIGDQAGCGSEFGRAARTNRASVRLGRNSKN